VLVVAPSAEHKDKMNCFLKSFLSFVVSGADCHKRKNIVSTRSAQVRTTTRNWKSTRPEGRVFYIDFLFGQNGLDASLQLGEQKLFRFLRKGQLSLYVIHLISSSPKSN
jgi:hypothetical protein